MLSPERRVDCVCVFQVREHSLEVGTAGATAPGTVTRRCTEWRHGDVTWHLSDRRLSGREPFKVQTRTIGEENVI